ncbi:MAG: polysaccharide deacetylase family protein, partial [Thermomicrobiaceae bacterium]|nr:polysaccharide deacetylase family protein [Thermomicrobiaceae bacterium]
TPSYLTWAMIRELDRSGLVEVGAHTVHHFDLPTLGQAAAQGEIAGSKQALEARLGHRVRSFCYPAGHYTGVDVAIVRGAGFQAAVTTHPGVARAGDDPLLLPRQRVHGTTSLARFARLVQ